MTISRVSAGIPEGGQFATQQHAEPGVALNPTRSRRAASHQHSQWQIMTSAQGGLYCGACGETTAEPGVRVRFKNDRIYQTGTLLGDAENGSKSRVELDTGGEVLLEGKELMVLPSTEQAEDMDIFADQSHVPDGTRVWYRGEYGHISASSAVGGGYTISLDGGGWMATGRRGILNMDVAEAMMLPDMDVPELEGAGHLPQEDVNRFLHAHMVGTRNAKYSHADPYVEGRGLASAEVASALKDPNSVPVIIADHGEALFSRSDSFLEAHVAAKEPAAPLTKRRARQLVGHFLRETVHRYQDYDPETGVRNQLSLGRANVNLRAAVSLINGLDRNADHLVVDEQAILHAIADDITDPAEILKRLRDNR